MIRVVIAEDQSMVRGALVALLSLEQDIDVVGDVASGADVVETVLRERPDVVLMDIEMPGMDGIAAAGAIRGHTPDCKVLILTTFGRPGYLRGAMDAGAVGFLVKDAPASQLADAIRRAMRGERVIDPELAMAALSSGPNPLTDRQREVLRLSLGGASISEMSKAMFLSEGTIRNYLSEAISKLDARNRVDAARIAEERGWL
ncbi:MAG TPA: response regulator transcription factor [Thermomicrobiales bacterium]|nr:response regulator transcription factor [Thermomicrobiales bacterium]